MTRRAVHEATRIADERDRTRRPRRPRGGTMLTPADLAAYRRDGFMVLPDILSAREIEALRRVTDDFVAAASRITANDDIYDLEDSHAPGEPRVRRIKT